MELHPAYDLWVAGARYGHIKGCSKQSGLVAVKMENTSVKGVRYFPARDLFEV